MVLRSSSAPIISTASLSLQEGHFVWAYSITIENHGRETVTLRTRYWKITDATGHVQEVRGAGVVGEQPMLKPWRQLFLYLQLIPRRPRRASWPGPTRCRRRTAASSMSRSPPSLDSPHEKPVIN